MSIVCDSLEVFLDTVRGLVERGLTFDAQTDTLTIKLTGCY